MAQGQELHTKVQYPPDSKCYKILQEIGRGASAIVYKAICIPLNSSVVAIKAIDLDQSRADFDRLRCETKIMSLLSHPNILQAHCCFAVDHRLWVVMPFMSCGSLQSIINSSFLDGIPEQCVAIVLRETLCALSYLHDQGHLHRDIKSGNILVDSNGSVKLADFGVSASIYEPSTLSGSSLASSSSTLMLNDVAGTPYWMAPEVIHSHKGYSFKADIWSLGITALELAHGRPPLSHLPPCKSLLMKFTKRFRFSDYEKGNDQKKKFSKSFKDMVGRCLEQDPSKRPSADKLLKHPFFKNSKGPDFLVKNVLQGLPTVERRFLVSKFQNVVTMNKAGEECEAEEFEGKNKKQRRISGWNFNIEDFELNPLFPSEPEDSDVIKQVRFGGESIILDKTGDSDTSSTNNSTQNVSETHMLVSQGYRGFDDIIRNNVATLGDQKYNLGSCVDEEVILSRLLLLNKSLIDESIMVSKMIGLVLGKKSPEISREEYLMQMVETLRLDLEAEKKKTCALQMELEFIKLHYSIE